VTRWVLAVLVAAACKDPQGQEEFVYHVIEDVLPRADVSPDDVWSAKVGLRPSDPGAVPDVSVESRPWAYDCEGDARPYRCGHIRTIDFLARAGSRGEDDVGCLLWWGRQPGATKRTAIVEFNTPSESDWLPHTSRMRVGAGDIIPTPRGRALVGEVRWPTGPDYDDASVTLHYLDTPPDPPYLFHVGSGAFSQLGSQEIAVWGVSAGTADVVLLTRHDRQELKVRLDEFVGPFQVVQVVNGSDPGALGWITLDTRPAP
jgi:hypothetical protein